jgi:hypothetical protein
LKLGNLEKKSEVRGKFVNLVLEKDEDHLNRPFEKLRVSKSQVGEDYLTHNKKKEG